MKVRNNWNICNELITYYWYSIEFFFAEIQELKTTKGLALEDILREVHLFVMRSKNTTNQIKPQMHTNQFHIFSWASTSCDELFVD